MSYDLSNLNILLVDDNEHMIHLIRTLLRALKIKNVQSATDGLRGFEAFKVRPVDIIITDWAMEPVDGIEFTRMVRNAPDSPNPYVPVVMMTGHSDLARVKAARDAGVTEFLAKPVSAKSLYTRLVEIIENPRPFVRSKTYFGPDRRRHNDENYTGVERRGKAAEIDLDELAAETSDDLSVEQMEALSVSKEQVDALSGDRADPDPSSEGRSGGPAAGESPARKVATA